MTLGLSHFEIKARDLELLEDFYTRVLGCAVTDRSPPGAYQMVFLSLNPGEHHQIVLAQATDGDFAAGSLDHLAFRTDGLPALRRFHRALEAYGGLPIETVSHGTTWSLYFRDPEGNRLELFADTPWHVAQPLRFPIDLTMADDELLQWTERQISALADFQPAEGWFEDLEGRLTAKDPDQD
jgi:catechol-2,3-dioxygenase